MWQGDATIVAREAIAPGYVKLSLEAPEIAAGAQPGLFANLLVEGPELCLRRPISFHGVAGDRVDIVVGVLGRGTAWLGERAVGETLDVMGPLGGRPLRIEPGAERVALVGGGVGIPPLRFLAQRNAEDDAARQLVAFVGARSAERLLCLEEFRELGSVVVPATDDGSAGFHGTVVEALSAEIEREPVDQILTCGPTPMMRAVAELALARSIPCQVCLEARMACALGACLSCVIETHRDGWQRYQRVCTEGPVFGADEVVWTSLSPLVAL